MISPHPINAPLQLPEHDDLTLVAPLLDLLDDLTVQAPHLAPVILVPAVVARHVGIPTDSDLATVLGVPALVVDVPDREQRQLPHPVVLLALTPYGPHPARHHTLYVELHK